MEKEIKIKTQDKHIIYGVLNELGNKSDKLIIFVHGLTGYKNEHIYYNAVKFFNNKGFSVFRFDLYSDQNKARLLSQCTIKIHVSDLNQVVDYFRKKFEKIFVVGHSMGGATILLSDTSKVDGIVLWDSSHYKTMKSLIAGDCKYNKCLGVYVLSWGCEYLIGKKMYDEWLKFPKPKELMNTIHKPIKIIVANKGVLMAGGKEYFKYANEPKSFSIIKKARHGFDEEKTEERLFQETFSWLRKF